MDQTPPPSAAAAGADMPPPQANEALQEELAKWRERVPKLASALRQRAEEAESLRRELERLRAGVAPQDGADPGSSAGVRARDALIGELEVKLSELADRHKNAQGELHTRQLTIDELRSEAEGWKRKWQSVTESLDEQDSRFSARDRQAEALQRDLEEVRGALAAESQARLSAEQALQEAADERDSLNQRNTQLFETTEVANRQIGSLTETLSELRTDLKGLRAQVQEAGSAREALQGRLAELESELGELRQRHADDVAALEKERDEARTTLDQERDAHQAALTAEQDRFAEATRRLRGDHEAAMAALRKEHSSALAEQARALEEQARTLDQARREAADASARSAALEAELETDRGLGASAERHVAALHEELHLVSAAAAFGLQAAGAVESQLDAARRDQQSAAASLEAAERHNGELEAQLDEERAETARLAEVVDTAQRRNDERERERRELVERTERAQSRVQHLEAQLEERSALVVNLEAQQTDLSRREAALERQRDELEEALMRAERHAKENGEHVTALDDRLERQKELMDSLEAELAEAQEEHTRALKAAHSEAGAEADRLRAQVRRLESELRERTEALNRAELEQELGQDGDPEAAAEPAPLEPPADPDGKLLLVLNQQLAAERTRNEELQEQLRALSRAQERGAEAAAEAAAEAEVDPAGAPAVAGDDLTRIHGVGQKLAEQLNELGIYHYRQIAEIDADGLDDEAHVLYAHRGRIMRDGWIDQAVRLIAH